MDEQINEYLHSFGELTEDWIKERQNTIVFNFYVPSGVLSQDFLRQSLYKIFNSLQGTPCRISLQAGYLLENTANNSLRYFYPAYNTELTTRVILSSRKSLVSLLNTLASIDFNQHFTKENQESNFILNRIVNLQAICFLIV